MRNEFGYPLPYSDFWELCDPNPGSCFHKPFDLGNGMTGMSNGRMVIRTLQAVHDSDKVENAEARERVEDLNWGFFNFGDRSDLRAGAAASWRRDWRSLRDRAGMLAGPAVAAWEPARDGRSGGFDFVDKPRLAVGAEKVIVPVSILQLMRRLPMCEVYVGGLGQEAGSGYGYRWLYFKFTNGTGMASSVPMVGVAPVDGVEAKYSIWGPRSETVIEGGLG